ncbi:MAG: hypothetical protein HN461_03525 [Rhodospirillaceae bacterium]|nr:hypothetical protein [Rhodospirillaceae bacterium]MBT4563436.1 hypothetical protein [Rhodospirillaceae bacterium]MBT4744085.1 hypothetical protein [Rhodospirillaceae bacterium]MBT5128289.1 hypothetical protein [Rhodospirillaceae bacterium]MBT6677231.1 hypothetical protein [Rhodospirillaceae bacterium]
MEQTYTLKDVAAILSPTGEQEAFDRASRQVRHWTINGLLETAGEKFVGTGRSRRYGKDEIRFDQPDLSGPAIMREFGRFDRPVTEIGA